MKDTQTTYASASFDSASYAMSSMRLPFVLCSIALAAFSAAMSGCDSHAANVAARTVNAANADNTAPHGQSRAEVFAHVKQITSLGEKLFFDPSLSGSGKLACASCHSPSHAFGPPNALSVQLGGNDMHQAGFRAVPSLRYLQSVPAFTRHFHDSDDEGDESVDAGPTGGLTWDGRVDRGSDQARIPILSSFEMGSTPGKVVAAVKASSYADDFRRAFGADVVAKLKRAPYAAQFRATFGETIFDDGARAILLVLRLLPSASSPFLLPLSMKKSAVFRRAPARPAAHA